MRRGGKMCGDVVLWVELVVDFLYSSLAQSERGSDLPLFSTTCKLNISGTFALLA